MIDSREPPPKLEQLQRQVAQLKAALRAVESHSERLGRRPWRQLLVAGVVVSVAAHIGLFYYLDSIYRQRPVGPAAQTVSYEFAILPEEELTEFHSTELEDLAAAAILENDEIRPDEPAAELEATAPAAELDIALRGSVPTLGGSGAEGGGKLVGGGAGTSFFGVGSRGMRFAYIVDRSGSMGQQRKMEVAMRELARSVAALPDYAYFYVLLFSSGSIEPPIQRDWMRARRTTVQMFIQWLNQVDPGGATEPVPAFERVFALGDRPDVIFFLTDGEIPDAEAAGDLIAKLNSGGRRVVINTIAFGDVRSQKLLRRLARDSGGTYRFVATEAQ